jgi:hypothetical protein
MNKIFMDIMIMFLFCTVSTKYRRWRHVGYWLNVTFLETTNSELHTVCVYVNTHRAATVALNTKLFSTYNELSLGRSRSQQHLQSSY